MRSPRLSLLIAALSLATASTAFAMTPSFPVKANKVMTQGLGHLGLTVKNLDASTDFFVNTLGWKKVGGYPDYPSHFVTDGKIFLTLWQTKTDKPVVNFDRKHNVGLHHLALKVASLADLNQLHQMFLTTKGVEVEFAPQPNNGGPTIHMMIREPSGNRIEFAYSSN